MRSGAGGVYLPGWLTSSPFALLVDIIIGGVMTEHDWVLFIQLGLLLAYPCGVVGFYVLIEPLIAAYRRYRTRRRLFRLCR